MPGVRDDLDRTPFLVDEVEVDLAVVPRNADVNASLGPIEPRTCPDALDGDAQCLTARRAAGRGVVAMHQPLAEAARLDSPCLAMIVHDYVGVPNSVFRVKKLGLL